MYPRRSKPLGDLGVGLGPSPFSLLLLWVWRQDQLQLPEIQYIRTQSEITNLKAINRVILPNTLRHAWITFSSCSPPLHPARPLCIFSNCWNIPFYTNWKWSNSICYHLCMNYSWIHKESSWIERCFIESTVRDALQELTNEGKEIVPWELNWCQNYGVINHFTPKSNQGNFEIISRKQD